MKLIAEGQVLPEEPQALLDIILRFNQACNWLSQIAFQDKLFHWLPLQRQTYHQLRQRFGLSSAEAVTIIRKVAYAYRNKARRTHEACFQPKGSIPLYKHSYKRTGIIRLYGHNFPLVPGSHFPFVSKHQAILNYRGGKFFIHQVYEAPEPTLYEVQDFLGVDLGIVNIATDSLGGNYAGGHLNGLRKRHFKLRQRLQQKGTKSAKRLLRHRSGKEYRFARDVNHCISKALVNKAQRHSLGLALEDLKGIRERITVRRGQRRQHHAWAFQQLRAFIEYKGRLVGVPIVLVDPRNTSRTCPRCGFISKANRSTQALFSCKSCGFAGLADFIAALNIRGRASGDRPYAVAQANCEFLEVKG